MTPSVYAHGCETASENSLRSGSPASRFARDSSFTRVQMDKLTNDLDVIVKWKQIDHCKKIPTQKQLDGWLGIKNPL